MSNFYVVSTINNIKNTKLFKKDKRRVNNMGAKNIHLFHFFIFIWSSNITISFIDFLS